MRNAGKTEMFEKNTGQKHRDAKQHIAEIAMDDKIRKMTIAAEDYGDNRWKIFNLSFWTEKGEEIVVGDDSFIPKECIIEVEIKPDEHVIGFFGNIGDALDGFGIYVMKDPVVCKQECLASPMSSVIDMKKQQEMMAIFDPKIEDGL